jgi:hypothetical protein
MISALLHIKTGQEKQTASKKFEAASYEYIEL